jgi:hypothetical protein
VGYAVTAAIVALLLTPGVAAHAQRVTMPDGSRYASLADYYAGTWKWQRPQPPQTAITRFGRDGSFFFHNLTNGQQHFGRYVPGARSFSVTFERSCADHGARCQPVEPPKVRDYPFEPLGSDLFKAGDERWERQKSNPRPSS